MPGIVIGEASSATNPLLPFFYQFRGFLANVANLRFEVYAVNGTDKLAEDTLDVQAVEDGGCRIATGYYFIPLDPEDLELEAGAYDLLCYYKVNTGDAEKAASYVFEVLDKSTFRIGAAYKSYVPSTITTLEGFSLAERQRALHDASKFVDFLTTREFFPRYMDLLHTMQESGPTIWLFQPVIGINQIAVTTTGILPGSEDDYLLDLSMTRVYNRHINGLLAPDDRMDPRIALELTDSVDRFFLVNTLPKGELNVKITGVFGYTDPDGTPTGGVPAPLQFVVEQLAYRKLADPSGTDPLLWNPSAIKKAKTRDQEIHFDTLISGANSELTGNARLDSILAQYMRPPYVGAV